METNKTTNTGGGTPLAVAGIGGNEQAAYITMEEAAALLGLTKNYMYKLTSRREIPFYKYGGRIVVFDRNAVLEWRAKRLRYVPTREEHEGRAAAYCAEKPLGL